MWSTTRVSIGAFAPLEVEAKAMHCVQHGGTKVVILRVGGWEKLHPHLDMRTYEQPSEPPEMYGPPFLSRKKSVSVEHTLRPRELG
jgi:hypothetical protein